MVAGECLVGEDCNIPPRVPLTLTNVLYQKGSAVSYGWVLVFVLILCVCSFLLGDLVGFVMAWFSLLPIFILVGFVTLILFNRNIHTVCF